MHRYVTFYASLRLYLQLPGDWLVYTHSYLKTTLKLMN